AWVCSCSACRSLREVARTGSSPRRMALDGTLKPIIVIETMAVDAAALKTILVIASAFSWSFSLAARGGDPLGQRLDFWDGGKQPIERLGHQLLRRPAGDGGGEAEAKVAIGIDAQGEGGLLSRRCGGNRPPRQGDHGRRNR